MPDEDLSCSEMDMQLWKSAQHDVTTQSEQVIDYQMDGKNAAIN
ncbi:hypothetical protein ACFPN3_00635 [Undibacterium jejuense]